MRRVGMREQCFDTRLTDNRGQQLRSRKILPQLLVCFVLLLGLVSPVSVAEGSVGSAMETEVSSFPATGADVSIFSTAAGDLCQRELPDTVTAGEEFAVTMTFVAPADRFHAIGLTDLAPPGWDVSVDVAWTEAQAMVAHTPQPEMAAYIWAGPYAAGVEFTAVYRIKVPIDAEPGTYGFTGSLEYYIEPHPAPSCRDTIAGDMQVDVVQVDAVEIPVATIVRMVGVTKEISGAILPGAIVTLYQNGEAIANVVSDENGNYEFEFSQLGDYDVVVSKEGFRDEVQSVSVTVLTTYDLDFVGDHGLIPDAPDKTYVLACADLWKSDELSSQLSTSRLLELISASKHPYPGL
jgi:hypothetical protein